MTKRRIEVVDYCQTWPQKFIDAKKEIAEVVGDNAVIIEHIGSTSVAGLSAKPIIDILLEVKSLSDLDAVSDSMSTIGFKPKGENGIEGRRYFQKGGNQRSHHLHAFESGHPCLDEHRAFKEYLIQRSDVSAQYDRVKRNAARYCNHDSQYYMELKNDFIQQCMVKALEFYSTN